MADAAFGRFDVESQTTTYQGSPAANSPAGTRRDVRAEGLEPSSSSEHRHLKPACLPISPRPRTAILRGLVSIRCHCRPLGLSTGLPTTRVFVTRTKTDFETVKSLLSQGLNDCEASRASGVPRSTVRDWRRGSHTDTLRSPRRMEEECSCLNTFLALQSSSYSYLLGLYLGDGCISRAGKVWRLRVTLDAIYPRVIDECAGAMEAIMQGKRAYRLARKGCVEVSMYSKHWPCLFPQHGPCPKHLRRIELVPWQQDLVGHNSQSFLRGLIHSDGCRVVVRDRTSMSTRYHFSNRSERHHQALLHVIGPPRHPLDSPVGPRHRDLPQGGGRAVG